MSNVIYDELVHLSLGWYVYVAELGHHWFRQRLVACSLLSHYPNQGWLLIKHSLASKVRWQKVSTLMKLYQIDEIVLRFVVCKVSSILSNGRWVKYVVLTENRTQVQKVSMYFHASLIQWILDKMKIVEWLSWQISSVACWYLPSSL